jgi:splicing factor 3A subunit 3
MPLEFTGEEMYGRYLDLHEFYHAFINLSRKAPAAASASGAAAPHAADSADGVAGEAAAESGANASTSGASAAADRPMEYITYVQQFTHFHRIPRAVKFQKGYLEYVQALLRYLISFHERTQPLKAVMKLLGAVEDSFEERWRGGEILGWEDRGEGTVPEDADLVIDPDAFDSPEELLELGARCLAETHVFLGLLTRMSSLGCCLYLCGR